MDRIGNHGRTLAPETCRKLADYQQNVHQASYQGHFVYLMLADG